MSVLLYNIGLFLYSVGIHFTALFNEKARKWILGREDIFSRLKQVCFQDTIWFHCASVGEFEQGMPLLKKLRDKYPDSSFLVTFFSPSGYEYARKRYSDLPIFYLPSDTKQHAVQFIEIIQPKAVFFIKYEFWFHYLNELKKQHIPTFLISGIFRKGQAFFSFYGGLHRRMLSCFTWLFLQNEESKKMLDNIGLRNSGVFGDTRFDRVDELSKMDLNDTIIQDFTKHAKVFIGGSVWSTDQETLSRIISLLPTDWKIILAPHEIGHYETKWIQEEIVTHSAYNSSSARILILDTLGVLSKLYRKASIVYIGGGYGKGIHNILEAAIYNIPILIGPKFEKFREAVDLVGEGVVFDMAENGTEKTLVRLLHEEEFYKAVRDRCSSYMSRQTNVSEKILVFLTERKLLS